LDLESLAQLGEFISGVVVIVSLVYVVVQLRLNTESIRNENYGRALDRIATMQSRLSHDGEYAELLSRGILDVSRLTPRERIQFTWIWYELFGAIEFIFHAAQNGSLSSEVWDRWHGTTAYWLGFPGVRAWWQNRPTPFSRSFTEYIDAQLREGTFDRVAADRWKGFVQDGGPPARGDLSL
jgi:hypothetical protein